MKAPTKFTVVAQPADFNGEGHYCKAGYDLNTIWGTWPYLGDKLNKVILNPLELHLVKSGKANGTTNLWVMFDLSNRGGADLRYGTTDRGFYVWIFLTREQARAFGRARTASCAQLSAVYQYFI